MAIKYPHWGPLEELLPSVHSADWGQVVLEANCTTIEILRIISSSSEERVQHQDSLLD